MTTPPDPSVNDLSACATAAAATRDAPHPRLWAMSREERIAAFYRG
jgi:hypothetical protein